MPKFSIIIPVYNVELYLKECVESVLAQTFSDYEIIIVDDGSTDKSGKICDGFALNESRIKVIHQENKGLSAARNTGIKTAEGDYLIFLDSDDFWYNSTVLEKISARIDKTLPQVLSFNFVRFDEKCSLPYFRKQQDMPIKENGLKYHIKNGLWIACAWNKAVIRSLFSDCDLNFREGITSEDVDWCLRLAEKADSLDFFKEVVVCYRKRNGSISNNITSEKINVLLNNIEICIELLQKEKNIVKAEELESYIAYQYGTALLNIAFVKEPDEKQKLIKKAKQKQYLLKKSKDIKIKMLYLAVIIFGFEFAIKLLKLYRQ